jgi:hypothetical protein
MKAEGTVGPPTCFKKKRSRARTFLTTTHSRPNKIDDIDWHFKPQQIMLKLTIFIIHSSQKGGE